MARDGFDRLIWLGLAGTLAALAVLLLGAPRGSDARQASSLDKGIERELAYQARSAFLQKIYGPVEELRAQGEAQRALLKLEELGRAYPGEAHGYLLKGAILQEFGALEESIASYVQGVKLNGDYVDEKSPLSMQTEIRQLVDRGLDEIGRRARANPDNRTLETALRNLYYLQSRLAGGCE
ncbi:hypothetical protein DESUT3_24110 [Desulfuromonas versatilis]|uniref:Tetratricopeptide repeat protein n=1 Tax=Desulfuromonas versatilis TaxID=2802975 RepID=A0ABM8HQM4_9BACT|nr:hypothetical protein [Desulfuromonas versatilis]BCR05342.1 hypothetical protein DESUT3_24110 [Desulfuromonas versatilis]